MDCRYTAVWQGKKCYKLKQKTIYGIAKMIHTTYSHTIYSMLRKSNTTYSHTIYGMLRKSNTTYSHTIYGVAKMIHHKVGVGKSQNCKSELPTYSELPTSVAKVRYQF